MSSPHLPALYAERQAVLDVCRDLSAADWAAPSAARGWSVADVLIHLTVGIRAVLTPTAVALLATRDLEQLNEQLVDERRSYTTRYLTRDFEVWSRRGCAALRVLTAPGPRAIRLPMAELGWYPLGLTPAMFVCDWHLHLRHDIALAVDRLPPPTDPPRMTAVIAWLMALFERSHREVLNWLDAPVALTLTGPGGGTWRIESRARGLRVRPGRAVGAAAHIAALAAEFPQWATRRLPWRACAVAVTGDTELGTRLLDSIRLI